MKKMLETSFPEIDVVLANYPPPLPQRVLSKLIPAFQLGVIGIIMAGEQIFPMLGIMVPPPWFYTLRANRFGSMATTWLLGNVLQSFLQSTGAFEVYLYDEQEINKMAYTKMQMDGDRYYPFRLLFDLEDHHICIHYIHNLCKKDLQAQVFSKLKEGRFSGEIELKDLIDKKLANPQVQDKYQDMLS